MKIQLASDLHLELLSSALGPITLVEPEPEADILILAGDVGNGIQAIDRFADWPVPVVYVVGNHEFYRRSWEQTRIDLKETSRDTRIHFLDNDVFEFGGVRFLGCTLWSDFRVRGYTQRRAMEEAELRLNDFYLIQTSAGPLRAHHVLADHEWSLSWLQTELVRPFEGKTVVVTHHAPSPLSVAPRFAGQPLNGAFASELDESLFQRADLWIHGHTHDPCDYQIGKCRVISNPAGYVESKTAQRISELKFENRAFNPTLVVDT